MVHEGGHAIHSMLTRDLEFVGFKELTSEIAELASMSMELISMEHWHHFFPNEGSCVAPNVSSWKMCWKHCPGSRVLIGSSIGCIPTLVITVEERTAAWDEVYRAFSPSRVDWNGHEPVRKSLWQKQLHLFEVPFYYIEYGMAQLGAIAFGGITGTTRKRLLNSTNRRFLGYTARFRRSIRRPVSGLISRKTTSRSWLRLSKRSWKNCKKKPGFLFQGS